MVWARPRTFTRAMIGSHWVCSRRMPTAWRPLLPFNTFAPTRTSIFEPNHSVPSGLQFPTRFACWISVIVMFFAPMTIAIRPANLSGPSS